MGVGGERVDIKGTPFSENQAHLRAGSEEVCGKYAQN